MESAVISVEDLKKGYKNVPVIKGINLHIRSGEIYALLGSNGAGKTTTIRILSTLLKPDQGTVKICGYDVQTHPDKVRECISLTGQYAAVDEVLTGRENLYMVGRLKHLSDVRGKTEELLEKFNLTGAGNHRVGTYSGGMRRKLDIAMSIIGSPPIIFLDEPTTGLDPQSRIAMWDIVKSLAKSGTTIFLTTQYLDEAEQLADTVAILHNGKLIKQGSPASLKHELPQGKIELFFGNTQDLERACTVLQGYSFKVDKEVLTLSVFTDESMGQLTDILIKMQNDKIAITEFLQKKPSLEDVFFTSIGITTGGESE